MSLYKFGFKHLSEDSALPDPSSSLEVVPSTVLEAKQEIITKINLQSLVRAMIVDLLIQ